MKAEWTPNSVHDYYAHVVARRKQPRCWRLLLIFPNRIRHIRPTMCSYVSGTCSRCPATISRVAATIVIILILHAAVESSQTANVISGGRFVQAAHATTTQRAYTDKLIDYLTTFGYLPATNSEAGNLQTDQQLEEALKRLQKFGNIPVTGELDESTKELFQRSRCGLPDEVESLSTSEYYSGTAGGSITPAVVIRRSKRYILHTRKWDETTLSWSLRSKYVQNLNKGQMRSVLKHALTMWSDDSRLTFREIDSDDADILIYFHTKDHNDGYPFDGRGGILAHAFFPGSGKGGDVHFDQDEEWNLDLYQEVPEHNSLLTAAAHEFGHSLGLVHSSVRDSIMYPWYQSLKANFQLSEDDRNSIQALYGPKAREVDMHQPTPFPDEKSPRIRPSYHPTYQPSVYFPTRPNDIPKPTHHWPRFIPPRPPQPSDNVPTRDHPSKRTSQSTSSPAPSNEDAEKKDFDSIPDTCDTNYDAISVIRNELFIFKDRYFWRLNDRGLISGYPAAIRRLWDKLPSNITRVDAVYERNDRKIVFFVGRDVYVFDGTILMNRKSLTSIGLPINLDHVDAAMVWGYNNKTFLFSGSVYWRLDDETFRVELDYPRLISQFWKGVEADIDTAFLWKDGSTYFFRGKGFWKFDNNKLQVTFQNAASSAAVWMKCPDNQPDLTTMTTEQADAIHRMVEKYTVLYTTSVKVIIMLSASFITVVTLIFVMKRIHLQPKTFFSLLKPQLN